MRTQTLTSLFGLQLNGIDLRSLSPSDQQTVINAGNRNGVVYIPKQHLSEKEQLAFTELFGTIRVLRANRHRKSMRPPGIVEISNVDPKGNIIPPDDAMLRFSNGNQLWHSDYSYTKDWAAQSILYALDAVTDGGETEFANTEAAYDALPVAEKARLSRLIATHDQFQSRIKTGYTDFTEEEYQLSPPVEHPLITTHPITGRKALLIGSHVSAINGMSREASETLLAELVAHSTQPQFVYSHRWTRGDVVIWDNRNTLHRGRPADPKERRVMRRTAVKKPFPKQPSLQ